MSCFVQACSNDFALSVETFAINLRWNECWASTKSTPSFPSPRKQSSASPIETQSAPLNQPSAALGQCLKPAADHQWSAKLWLPRLTRLTAVTKGCLIRKILPCRDDIPTT